MPRRVRCYLPHFPYHIVQRSRNRQHCFSDPEDYLLYVELWRQHSAAYGVRVHAYCLMKNHIHVLATPEHDSSIPNTMRTVGSRYARYINRKYRRTGALWEGRHRASLIQSDKYLLTCSRYIELNPVRCYAASTPENYQWSSYVANGLGRSSWVTPHDEYLQLGTTAARRAAAYRALFMERIGTRDLHLIRKAVHYGQPTGDNHFQSYVAEKYGIRLGQMKRGRPRKDKHYNGSESACLHHTK